MTAAATTAELIQESRKAIQKATKDVLKSPEVARALLIKAGICERTKDGVRLAKPYR